MPEVTVTCNIDSVTSNLKESFVMKKVLSVFATMALSLLGIIGVAGTASAADVVDFGDPELKKLVNLNLATQLKEERALDQDVYVSEMKRLTFLTWRTEKTGDHQFTSLKGLEHATNITSLGFGTSFEPETLDKITDFTPLKSMTQLQKLFVTSVKPMDWSVLSAMPNLTSLNITNDCNATDLSMLAHVPQLTHLSVDYLPITDISGLRSLTDIDHIAIQSTAPIADLSALDSVTTAGYIQVRYINQDEVAPSAVTALPELNNHPNLWFLDLDGFENVTTVPSYDSLPALQQVSLNDMPQATTLPTFSGSPSLTEMTFYNFGSVTQLPDWSHATDLDTLMIAEFPKLTSLAPLAQLPSDTEVMVEGTPLIKDYSALGQAGSGYVDITVPSTTRTSMIIPDDFVTPNGQAPVWQIVEGLEDDFTLDGNVLTVNEGTFDDWQGQALVMAANIPEDDGSFMISVDYNPQWVAVKKSLVDAGEPGGTATWAITVENVSDVAVGGVKVVDDVDGKLLSNPVITDTSAGTVADGTWLVGDLAVGGTATATVTTDVSADAVGQTVTNTVRATFGDLDWSVTCAVEGDLDLDRCEKATAQYDKPDTDVDEGADEEPPVDDQKTDKPKQEVKQKTPSKTVVKLATTGTSIASAMMAMLMVLAGTAVMGTRRSVKD